MPDLKTYDLFISHAWKYGDEYNKLVNFLNNTNYFKYRNYSAPEQKPLFPPGKKVADKEIREKIENKIRPVNIVLILSGMYYNHHEWIQEELKIAKDCNKPIIAVKPWGAKITPTEISVAAKEVVGWNTDSIVNAIRKYAI